MVVATPLKVLQQKCPNCFSTAPSIFEFYGSFSHALDGRWCWSANEKHENKNLLSCDQTGDTFSMNVSYRISWDASLASTLPCRALSPSWPFKETWSVYCLLLFACVGLINRAHCFFFRLYQLYPVHLELDCCWHGRQDATKFVFVLKIRQVAEYRIFISSSYDTSTDTCCKYVLPSHIQTQLN